MQSQTYLCLFDRVRLFVDGRVFEQFQTTKCRDLLAILATSPEYRVERNTLVRRLWLTDEGGQVNNRLSVCLYLLKKDLRRAGIAPDSLLRVTPRTISLITDAMSIDRDLFDQAIEEARAGTGRQKECYEAAVNLYSGALLGENRAPWAEVARIEAQRKHQEAVLWLADSAKQAGDPESAIDILRRCIAVDPLSDKAAAMLMTWLREVGDMDEAVAYAHQLTAYHAGRGTAMPYALNTVIHGLTAGLSMQSESGTVKTVCLVDEEHKEILDKTCETAGVYWVEAIGCVQSTDLLSMHKLARMVIAKAPEARLLVHSYVDTGEPERLDTMRHLHNTVPNGEVWATLAAATLLGDYNPDLVPLDYKCRLTVPIKAD